MTEQTCPACGCDISGAGYQKGEATYCCPSCAEGSGCGCDCDCQQSKATDMPDSGGE